MKIKKITCTNKSITVIGWFVMLVIYLIYLFIYLIVFVVIVSPCLIYRFMLKDYNFYWLKNKKEEVEEE